MVQVAVGARQGREERMRPRLSSVRLLVRGQTGARVVQAGGTLLPASACSCLRDRGSEGLLSEGLLPLQPILLHLQHALSLCPGMWQLLPLLAQGCLP